MAVKSNIKDAQDQQKTRPYFKICYMLNNTKAYVTHPSLLFAAMTKNVVLHSGRLLPECKYQILAFNNSDKNVLKGLNVFYTGIKYSLHRLLFCCKNARNGSSGATALSMTTLSIATFSIMGSFVTLSINNNQIK
jgi:hypothetical protein